MNPDCEHCRNLPEPPPPDWVTEPDGCRRCGDRDHCACYHAACCVCGSKGHSTKQCGLPHPSVDMDATHHADWCATCVAAAMAGNYVLAPNR